MTDWSSALAERSQLAAESAAELDERGFLVLPGAVPAAASRRFADAYDGAVAAAAPGDTHVGRTTTRVNDFVNRGPAFDDVYLVPALLAACWRLIGRPFKLSSFHARTLRPGAGPQELHVDVQPHTADWPLVGFILMVDPFHLANGATRFIPGSHRSAMSPVGRMHDAAAPHPDEALATGAAGSLLIFNGSCWHGHTANHSAAPRRSLQGAYIPSGGCAATDFAARMDPTTRARLSSAARSVLGI